MAEIAQAMAIARGVTQTPRKLSLVASLVRGRSVADALVILEHTPKRAAMPIVKVISSAQANATNTQGLKPEGLMIKSLEVTTGNRLKRFRPAARGRALPYQKITSHVKVVLSGEIKPKRKPAASSASAKKEKQ